MQERINARPPAAQEGVTAIECLDRSTETAVLGLDSMGGDFPRLCLGEDGC